jgi:hypothetical protein
LPITATNFIPDVVKLGYTPLIAINGVFKYPYPGTVTVTVAIEPLALSKAVACACGPVYNNVIVPLIELPEVNVGPIVPEVPAMVTV